MAVVKAAEIKGAVAAQHALFLRSFRHSGARVSANPESIARRYLRPDGFRARDFVTPRNDEGREPGLALVSR